MRPAFEGRLGFARGSTDTPREINVGVSGHYGWRRSVYRTERGVGSRSRLQRTRWTHRRGWRVLRRRQRGAFRRRHLAGRAAHPEGGPRDGSRSTERATLTGGFGRDKPADALGPRDSGRTTARSSPARS